MDADEIVVHEVQGKSCHVVLDLLSEEKKDQFGIGSVWTWTAIDADTKLVPAGWSGHATAGPGTFLSFAPAYDQISSH